MLNETYMPLAKTPKIIVFILFGLALVVPILSDALAEPVDQLLIGTFSQAQPGDPIPSGWEPLTFEKIPKHTEYELVRNGEQIAIKATSKESSSGLTKEVSIDPKEYPIVQWKWKIENILENGDVTQKSGDDYPARIYITFEYNSKGVGFLEKAKYEAAKLIHGQYPPIGAITYIWESKSPTGIIVPNPYTDRVKMIVVESGAKRLHEWITEERNVYEDYKKAFGEEPPKISGVAIMTDTDNTRESAIAYYGDIVFKKSEQNQE